MKDYVNRADGLTTHSPKSASVVICEKNFVGRLGKPSEGDEVVDAYDDSTESTV